MPDCNVAGHFDRSILGEAHMFSHPTCRSFKKHPCYFMDPEGLFTTIGAAASVFLGLYTGIVLLMLPGHRDRLTSLALQFCACLVLASVLGLAAHIPINKNLCVLIQYLSWHSIHYAHSSFVTCHCSPCKRCNPTHLSDKTTVFPVLCHSSGTALLEIWMDMAAGGYGPTLFAQQLKYLPIPVSFHFR